MNRPDRFEAFVLADGQEKLTYSLDTMMTNAGTFVVEKEDHTLGNLLRMQLLRDKRVLFGGYRTPHPLQSCFELKVRTTEDTNPTAVVRAAIRDLSYQFRTLEESLQSEVSRFTQNGGVDTPMF